MGQIVNSHIEDESMTTKLTDEEFDLMHHAVGEFKGYKGHRVRKLESCYRNCFAASPGSHETRVWRSLVVRNLAVDCGFISPYRDCGFISPYRFYKVIQAGAEALRAHPRCKARK